MRPTRVIHGEDTYILRIPSCLLPLTSPPCNKPTENLCVYVHMSGSLSFEAENSLLSANHTMA